MGIVFKVATIPRPRLDLAAAAVIAPVPPFLMGIVS
jgi:hypothetical protein